MTRTAFYPGSFDPLNLGHMDIARRACVMADKLVVAVGTHHGKKPRLDVDKRLSLIESELGGIAKSANSTLSVTTFDGLAVDAARAAGATIIIRGLRNVTDFDYELPMSQMNAQMAPDIETVFLATGAEFGFISSTLVRQISAMSGDVSKFVSPKVQEALNANR